MMNGLVKLNKAIFEITTTKIDNKKRRKWMERKNVEERTRKIDGLSNRSNKCVRKVINLSFLKDRFSVHNENEKQFHFFKTTLPP